MGAEAILGTPEGRHMPRQADTRVRTAVHLAVLLAAACSATASAANLPFTVQTPRYEVQTDVSPGFTQLVAAHMEQINAEYARRFPGFAQGSQRFRVLVFAGERGYRRAVPRAVWGSTGVFAAPEGFLAAHLEGRTVEEVLRTLYHEGFHQFVRTAVSRTFPTWLNEGLAEYFSEATWDGRGFTAGLVPTMRLHTVQEAIRHQEYVPLDRLFSLTADSWLQNVQTGGRRADIYYCEAWSVVQFLMHGEEGRHVRALDALLKAVAEGRPAEDARREVFGPDLRAVEDAWARYMMSLTPSPKFQCRDNMEIIMVLARHGDGCRMIPEEAHRAFPRPAKTLPRVKGTHQADFFRACRGGAPACSNFNHSGPLAEIVLLGNLAILAGRGRRIEWDGPALRCTNLPELNRHVKIESRAGWSC